MKMLLSSLLSMASMTAMAESITNEQVINSVVTEKVEYKDIEDDLVYPGRISHTRNVAVPAEIDGRVSSLKLALGQHVTQGMVLMTLRNSDPVYDYRAFQVRAPLSGVVTKLEVTAADLVSKGKTLLTIADNSQLKVLVQITSGDAAFIQVGHTARMVVAGKEYKLKVKGLSKQLDSVTGTVACELTLASPSPSGAELLPGSVVDLRFSVNKRNALVVSQRALVFRGRELYVIRIQGGNKAEYVPARILRQGLGTVELQSEIKAGDAIVVNAEGFVTDGEIVKVEGQEG